jgi:exodeoxyribonuclease VII large subunit
VVEQPELEMSVSEFVALLNQTMEFAYPSVTVTGELANFRVSKNRWVYFDLKDEGASVKFFGTVYQLPGPLEDGMLLKVRGTPRLHNLYGFSVNIFSLQPAGEGSIRKAADLLKAKLEKEGLFDPARKRLLAYPPRRIGLITSLQSAAYADFIKIINARWQGLYVDVVDVQVQGEAAPAQIIAAIEQFNALPEPPDVLVMIRGGGSPEDLAAFSTEQVTRAVAASRVPTLAAIGHEIDLSLAELAADQRASTPSNAAELLVPDKRQVSAELRSTVRELQQAGSRQIEAARRNVDRQVDGFEQALQTLIRHERQAVAAHNQLLEALNPTGVLRRGYAIVRQDGRAVRAAKQLKSGAIVDVQVAAGSFTAAVKETK